MLDAKILSPLLDEDYGENRNDVVTIVQRYLMIMGAQLDGRRLFSARTESVNSHIRFLKKYQNYNDYGDDGAVRLNTKEAPVEQYLKKALNIDVEVRQYPEKKETIIEMTNPTNFSMLVNKSAMLLLAIYPKLVPWLCPTISETDKKVITALSSGRMDLLIAETDKVVDEKLGDFRTAKMMKYLKLLQSRTHEAEFKQCENLIETYNESIKRLMDDLEKTVGALRDAERQLTLLSTEECKDGDDLIRFFKSHKQLRITRQEGQRVIVNVDETIQYYDEKALDQQLHKIGTFWYSLDDEMKKVVRYVFLNKKAYLRVSSTFSIDSRLYVGVVTGETYDEYRMPHPHLNRFGCLGTNSSYLADYNSHGDWDLAIEQMIAASKNINIFDRAVMGYMIDFFRSHDKLKIFEDAETGELMSTRDIIEKED